jgi:zinc transport system substrate-binding protein
MPHPRPWFFGRAVLVAVLLAAFPLDAAPLRVGVTLHPYYSWVKHVVAGTDVEVVSILPGDVDIDGYTPAAQDIARLGTLDVLVKNGLGHDAVIDGMVAAANTPRLIVVAINQETATLPEVRGKAPNSHTFLSLTNAVQQSALLARTLGQILVDQGAPPATALRLQENAAGYSKTLRRMLGNAKAKLEHARVRRVVTVHDGYGYLLQELGLELVGVVEPAHGLLPSAAELADLIALVRREKIEVVFAEERFPRALAVPLEEAGVRTYVISHVATGPYRTERFEEEMQKNLDTIVAALTTARTPG